MKLTIAGVDEAGRGPLAGSVVAAAVVLNPGVMINGLTDSKSVSENQRELLYKEIRETALAWAVDEASAAEIDTMNIRNAAHLAMQRAVAKIEIPVDRVLVDGNFFPEFIGVDKNKIEGEAIIKGDLKVPEISAASILAKVTRDRQLIDLDKRYPDYGFSQHKGYPTKHHIAMLKKYGPCPEHRKTFGPVKKLLEALGV